MLTRNTSIKSINLFNNGFGIDSAKAPALAACLEANSAHKEL